MANSWESKFPHPGPAPSMPEPTTPFDPAMNVYNKWVSAMRMHNIAKAIDTLIEAETKAPLNAVETIAVTVGVMLLDGSIKDSGSLGLLGMLF